MQPSQSGGPPRGPIRASQRPTRPAAGPTRLPGPVPSQAMAIHSAMLGEQLVRSVAQAQRYNAQLRSDQAADRLAQQNERYYLPVRLKRYLNELRTPFSPAWMAAHSKPTAFVRRAPTPLEKLQAHVMATNSSEIGLMMRCDPVTRSVAAAGAVVTGAVISVEAAPVLYEAGETSLMQGLERGAVLLEEHGAMLSTRFGGVTGSSFMLKGGLSAAGQFTGNYLVEHDAILAARKINLLSAAASGFNVPLGYTSLLSAGASISVEDGIKSLPAGSISTYEFGRDALFNYTFGKISSGFKIPAAGGRSWMGLDNLYKGVTQSKQFEQSVGFGMYQSYIRFGPRISYGLGVGAMGLATGLEHSNKVATGAAKKYLSKEVKIQFPDKTKP